MGAPNYKDTKKNRALFLKQFIERPTEVASIVPSSEELVHALIARIDYETVRLAVEYGPGTGAITETLRPLLQADAKYLAAEPNEAFRQHLLERGLNIEMLPDYAQNIGDHVLETYGTVDLVVSGLPCSVIPIETLKALFTSTHRILRNGGEFRMFIYTHTLLMPKMHDMLSALRQRFSAIETKNVWFNLPPATVIKCIK